MGILAIYGIGCLVVLVIILMYLFNEHFHHQDVTVSCFISCLFLVAMSWASVFVVLWVVAMKVLEFFKIDEKVVIKGKKNG